jgi:hypothetical protein
MYAGAYSPASSTFEGSIAYSDSEEYQAFGMSSMAAGQSPIFSDVQPSYGAGFVPPIQPVWI